MVLHELRVHGVSGTPPRDMLYTDPVTDDLANDYTKIYERPTFDDRFSTKAFHWGGLTSGSWITALWIFLAPFVFANIAGWMAKRTNTFGKAMVRLAGLGLSALFVVQLSTALVRIPYERLENITDPSWFDDRYRQALVMVMFAATAWIFYRLVRLSAQSHFLDFSPAQQRRLLFWPSIDSMDIPSPNPSNEDPAETPEPDWSDPGGRAITDPTLWAPHNILHRLRRLHLASGLVTVALTAAVWSGVEVMVWVSLIAFTFLLVITTLSAYWPEARPLLGLIANAPVASLLLLGVILIVAALGDPLSSSPDGIHTVTLGVVAVMGIFALASFAAGSLTVGALVVGTQLGVVLGIAVAIVVEQILGVELILDNGAAWVGVAMLFLLEFLAIVALALSAIGSTKPTNGATRPLPSPGRALTIGRRVELEGRRIFQAAAVFGLGAFILASVRVWEAGSEAAKEAGGGWLETFLQRIRGGFQPSTFDPPQVGGVVENVAIGLAVLIVLLLAWRTAAALSGRRRSWGLAVPGVAVIAVVLAKAGLFDFKGFGVEFTLTNLVNIAIVTTVLIPGIFMFRSVGSGARSGADKRRKVGILWDLGSFWPRWFHPLAPPAYGPVAINDLRSELVKNPPDVLGAHSQGSLIAAVAMAQIPVAASDSPGGARSFITYGSQLGILYPRMFPGVGLEGLVSAVEARLPNGWINLWRNTDPIGGQYVEALHDANWQLTTTTGHSRYEQTDEYQAARELLTPDPDSDSGEMATEGG